MKVAETSIPGLLQVDLDVHGDSRGWFKESYQRAKLEALGLPRLEAVQNNVSYNAAVGVTRGIHAEPWDKYISPASGRVFAATSICATARASAPSRRSSCHRVRRSTCPAAAGTPSARSSSTRSTTTW